MATIADLSQLQIYLNRRDISEAVGPYRTGEIGEPINVFREGLTVQRPDTGLRLAQDERRGHRECLAIGWKASPVSPDPASAADFGDRFPSGIAIVPKDGAASYETFVNVPAVDDHATEPNEHFRIVLTDALGKTIWGDAEPDSTETGGSSLVNPKAAVYTIHDTERDCARPGMGSGYVPSVEEQSGTYRLIIKEPEHPRQCAYIAWRYLDDTLSYPDGYFDTFLQGMAYFSSDEDSAGLGGYQQSFDLGIPFNKLNAGRSVRIIWGTTSTHPVLANLKLPTRRGP